MESSKEIGASADCDARRQEDSVLLVFALLAIGAIVMIAGLMRREFGAMDPEEVKALSAEQKKAVKAYFREESIEEPLSRALLDRAEKFWESKRKSEEERSLIQKQWRALSEP